MAKYAAAEAAIAAVDAAIQAHGGNGLASEYGLIPYWGLARLLRIAPVNREMILNYIGDEAVLTWRPARGLERSDIRVPRRRLLRARLAHRSVGMGFGAS